MANQPFKIVTHRIFSGDSEQGAYVDVGPYSEIDGMIVIHTPNKDSCDYWGEFQFAFPVEMAELLADAILKAKQEIEESS